MIKDALTRNLHKIYRQDKWLNELLNSAGLTLDNVEISIKDLEQQYWFDTMTWAIPMLEKKLKFKTNANSSVQERRNQLEARWKSNGKTSGDLISGIVEVFTKNLVKVSFKNRINICAINHKSPNLNLYSLFNAIEEIKPAHLNYDVNLQTQTSLNSSSKYKKVFNSYHQANDMVCGVYYDDPVSLGRLIKLDTKIVAPIVASLVEYPICGGFVCEEVIY